RRTCRVDGEVRTMQAKHVSQSSRRYAVRRAGGEVGIDRLYTAAEQHRMIVARSETEIHAGPAAGQLSRRLSRVFQRLPADFHQHALLRVHTDRFASGDPEEGSIELIDLLQKAAPPGGHTPGRVRIRVVPGIDIPAVGRDLGYSIPAAGQQGPKTFGAVGSARHAAAESHH